MNINIEVMERGSGFWAFASDGTNEKVGRGDNAWKAAGSALAFLLNDEAPVQPTVGPVAARGVAYGDRIRSFIESAIESDSDVLIDYTDVAGRKSWSRSIQPRWVDSADNVVAFDNSRGAVRQFRMSRISKAEM